MKSLEVCVFSFCFHSDFIPGSFFIYTSCLCLCGYAHLLWPLFIWTMSVEILSDLGWECISPKKVCICFCQAPGFSTKKYCSKISLTFCTHAKNVSVNHKSVIFMNFQGRFILLPFTQIQGQKRQVFFILSMC